jgi:hypothetical protein
MPVIVSTLAGTAGRANGNGTAASFDTPYGVAIDSFGNVYVADSDNHLIRKITAAGSRNAVKGKKKYVGI